MSEHLYRCAVHGWLEYCHCPACSGDAEDYDPYDTFLPDSTPPADSPIPGQPGLLDSRPDDRALLPAGGCNFRLRKTKPKN